MRIRITSRTIITFCLLSLVSLATPALAQQEGGEPGAPTLHQPGKDVQWVPTPEPLVQKMLDLAKLTPKDTLVDLGSGDGVLVIAAARRGVRARGIEYDRGLVAYSRRKAKEAGVTDKVKIVRGDIFKTDFSDATVVTTFLLPSMNLQLRPTFLRMKPGTRIVANTFSIADWEPDEQVALDQILNHEGIAELGRQIRQLADDIVGRHLDFGDLDFVAVDDGHRLVVESVWRVGGAGTGGDRLLLFGLGQGGRRQACREQRGESRGRQNRANSGHHPPLNV